MAHRTALFNALLLMVACLLVAVSRCRAGLQHTCSSDSQDQTPRGICGRRLSNLLAMICRSGGYNKRIGLPAGMPLSCITGKADTVAINGKAAYTRCNRLYNLLYTRLHRVYRHFPGCTTGCTTGCIVYTGFNSNYCSLQ